MKDELGEPTVAWAGALPSREEQREQKRRALLRMAARMFAQQGYRNTSLAQIAGGLNVSKPTLYYYIRNKDEMLNACVAEGVRTVEGFIAEANASGSNGLEKLRLLFRRHVEFLMDDLGALLAQIDVRDLNADSIAKLATINVAVEAMLKDAMADGSVAPLDPKSCCFALFGAFNQIPRWYRQDRSKSLDQIVAEYLDLFVTGLRPR